MVVVQCSIFAATFTACKGSSPTEGIDGGDGPADPADPTDAGDVTPDASSPSDDPDVEDAGALCSSDGVPCGDTGVCHEGECCQPQTCDDLGDTCGSLSDGCGRELDCPCDPVFRVTEYQVSQATEEWNLALNHPLAPDYFILIRGAAAASTSASASYARLIEDPHGTGQLGSANLTTTAQLRMHRRSAAGAWNGVITVVECLSRCDTAGFRLLDVRSFELEVSGASGTLSAGTAWTDLSRVMLVGGVNGAGVTGNQGITSPASHTYHLNVSPSGVSTIHWARGSAGGPLATHDATIMVVQWGSEWTVQRRAVSGSSWGASAAVSGHYDAQTIDAVPRANTWVWGTGYTGSSGTGNSAEGSLIALGNGASNSATEMHVAVGQQMEATKSFTVYALTHPDLMVDHVFRSNATSTGTTDIELPTAHACAAPASGSRMALAFNGLTENNNWPASIFRARYHDDTTIRITRPSGAASWAAWVQGVQFCNIHD